MTINRSKLMQTAWTNARRSFRASLDRTKTLRQWFAEALKSQWKLVKANIAREIENVAAMARVEAAMADARKTLNAMPVSRSYQRSPMRMRW